MSRGKPSFSVTNLKRAWKAAIAAGAVHPRVDVVLTDGTMLSISDDGTSGRGPHYPAPTTMADADLDAELAAFEARNGQG